MVANDLIEFKQPVVNIIKLKDEWDANEMKEVLHKYDRVFISANLPGSGKTTAVKNSGSVTDIITPYNKLCPELRKEKYDSVTLNKLLNINIVGEHNKNAKHHDISKYESICFDEIKLYGPHYLAKIYDFMNKTDKKIFATGDSDQIQPFGFYFNNVKDVKEYLDRCINIMFPNQIVLEHNKRLKTKEDQELLKQIKKDIFNVKMDISTTMKKYFKTIRSYRDLKTTKNISFFNFRSEKINKVLQKRMKINTKHIEYNEFMYYEGLELICKKHYKTKDKRLFTNYTYILDKIDDKSFTVLEPVDNVKMTFEIKFLTYFKLPWCLTCHSVQGLSIDDKVTLFDCNTAYVDRNFVWTAITRVRDLKNITFFEHSPEEVQRLEDAKLRQFIKLKIDGNKRQDIDAKRKIEKDKYVDVQWFSQQVLANDRCPLCCCKYYIVTDEKNKIMCNISIDRIDNRIAHHRDNCHLMCIECNKSKR